MSLLEMSLSGAVMILVIVVLRALVIHRLPKKTFLALWGMTLVRLLVPYSIPSAFSAYSLLGKLLSPARIAPLNASVPAVQPVHLLVPGTGITPSVPTATVASPAVPSYRLVWMVGALVCAAFFAVTYLKCRREFREALPVDDHFAQDWLKEHPLYRSIRLRQSDRISAPLTYGVFCPVILLPKRIDWDDKTALAYVLTHEYIHIRRFDAVTKMVLAAALCVHWFNPSVWVMYVLANRDLELSCDEAVIRLFGERTKSAYAMTLIRMEEKRSGIQPLCNNFSEHAMEERMIAIMKTKKTSWIAVLAAMALVTGVATAFATSGQAAAQGTDGNNALAQNSADTFTFEGTLGMDAKNAKLIANSKWFPDYEQYGLSYDAQQGVLSYNGELISFFHDETAPGVYTHVNFSQGAVGIEVKRNADWEIIGLIVYSTWADDVTVQEGSMEQTFVTDRTISSTDFHEPTRDELLAEYGKFGISFDVSGKMLYQNKPVRWFADFVEMEEGVLATRYVYRIDEGTEYIHTVRNRIDKGDNSYDPFGPLLEIVPWESGERDDFGFLFQGSQINATSEAIGNDHVDGITFQSTMSDYTVMSYTDSAEGITYYSMDDGKTWIPMTDEEFSAASGGDTVEWWTAEEYSAWLEREKVDLQSIIGSKGWTPSTGWFTWTQEMVDETIDKYEQTLRDIQAGQKISKPISDGDTMILFDYDSDAQDSRFMLTPQTTQEAAGFGSVGDTGSITFEERFSKYKDFGITYVEADGASGRGNVYLNGSLVSHFADVAPDGSTFSFTSAENGGMIVHTEYDSHGHLIGIQKVLPDAVDQEANGQ